MPDWIKKSDILAQQIDREIEKIRAKRQRFLPEPVVPPTVKTPLPVETLTPTFEQEIPPQPVTPAIPSWVKPPVALKEEAPSPLTFPKIEEQKPPWYEQPKMLTEKVMEGIARGIEKIPGAPQALKFVSPVFEFIHEKIEEPWAAIITAPFSPRLPYREGETWLEHEEREYKTWKAPTYVKGAVEFAMPLWWMPWLGWAGKGARALGVGKKVIRELGTLPKAGKLVLPSEEVLNKVLYKVDPFKRLALWAENKPVLRQVVKAIGGESAFVRAEPRIQEGIINVSDVVKRQIVNRSVILDMRHGAKGIMLPRLQRFGNPLKILEIDENGLVGAVIPKRGNTLGRGLSDVIEHPELYRFTSKQAKDFVMETRKIIKEVTDLAQKEGVKVPKGFIFHRMVKGKELPPDLAKKLGTAFEESEYGSLFEVARHHATWESGIKAGVKYSNDPLESVASTIDHYIKKIADKRFNDVIGKFGKTPMEKFAADFPEEALRIADLTMQRLGAKYARRVITKILSYKATAIPAAAMRKIREGLPDIAQRLDDVFAIAPAETDQIVSAMGKSVLKVAKIKPKEFKEMLAQFVRDDKIRLSDVSETIRQWNITERAAQRAIARIYKQAYQLNKQRVNTLLEEIRSEVDGIIEKLTAELKPLKAARAKFLKKYHGRQVLGTMEARFRFHPVFKNKFFPKEIVEITEKYLGDKGTQWVKNLGALAGTSRMLTASLDFSAPFIQGLAVLGRNPMAWAKAVKKQFEFFINPRNMYKYMTSPEAMAIRAERLLYGGSASTFEFFEVLRPLQRAVGKIPVVGKFGKKLIGQAYGRAEAAFTGFGEVARNEMWKAFRRPNMTDDQLRELARLTDRMTGVMSTEALAIGITQRDAESAFMFFAPRYTRASLSFMADLFKGGMTGAEARKSIAALMASGMAMYSGVCAVLGQEPEFNPRSAKFMTIKVGDSRIGIGGILYGLLRLGAGVVVTAGEQPSDLFQPFKGGALNRFDNPFLRFIYQRTSPLTSMTVGMVVEQKNYFGEPFESPADWAKFLADKVTPIALQSVAPWGEEALSAPVFAAEVVGGRTFPKSAWELRDEARDRIAKEEFGKPYEALPKLHQKAIDKRPEIQALQKEADVRTAQIGGLSYEFLQWRQERERAWDAYKSDLESAQKGVDAGELTTYEFKVRLQKANAGLNKTYEHINHNPKYKEVIKKLEEPKDINKEYIGDVIYDLLNQARTAFEDEYGIFDFDGYEAFKEKVRQVYGDEAVDYAEQRVWQKRKELPPLAQEYYKAQEVLKPYWNVQKEVERIYGKPRTEYQKRRIERVVSAIRKRMRLTNPQIARYYEMFYKRT
jgi:hypothetical protein